MDDLNTHAYGEDGPTDAEIADASGARTAALRSGFRSLPKRLAALEAENAALEARGARLRTAARDGTVAEREALRPASGAACRSTPIQTDYDRVRQGAEGCCRDVAEHEHMCYCAARPSTPVGWSDTDCLKHLEEIRRTRAALCQEARCLAVRVD